MQKYEDIWLNVFRGKGQGGRYAGGYFFCKLKFEEKIKEDGKFAKLDACSLLPSIARKCSPGETPVYTFALFTRSQDVI